MLMLDVLPIMLKDEHDLSVVCLVKGAALKHVPTIVNDVKLVFDPKELR